ncbi:MAG TPA: hypothetical protein VF432_12930 [Thermoanaerobaculia bacterium]
MIDGPIRLLNHRLWRGDKPVTEAFAAIDSFDYLESRDEVVFSAKKESSFDIGLAAGDGSKTNWLPADAADELAVQWAPRGNKVSYIVRAKLGDVVRTLHIPTSFQYVVDFGNTATIRSLTWDAAAERFTVAYSTLDASERTESIHYNGSARRTESGPQTKIAADLVPFGSEAFALRPRDVRYDEKLPAVVWVSDRFTWSDARAALMRDARVASIVVTRAPDAEFWKKVRETAWLDASKLYVVNGSAPDALSFVADGSVPAGRYRRAGNVVAAAPAAIQSVAAGFIADQWKRTSPANGSSRRE